MSALINDNLISNGNNWGYGIATIPSFKEDITYDANGNILTYNRNGNALTAMPLDMDKLTYLKLPIQINLTI